jgi:hypothetical protein
MKKTIITILTAIIVLLGGGVAYNQLEFGRGSDASFNRVGNMTGFATTTGSYCITCPVKLLDLDSDRRYAVIQNLSDTDIYLYATTTDLGIGFTGTYLDPLTNASGPSKTATSTEMSNVQSPQFTGILLEANGQPLSEIVFDADNMIYGHIWATSTAVSKQIQVNYK